MGLWILRVLGANSNHVCDLRGFSIPLPCWIAIWVNGYRLLWGRTQEITTACTSHGVGGYFQMEIQPFNWWVLSLTYLKLTNNSLWKPRALTPFFRAILMSSQSDQSPCLNVWSGGGSDEMNRAQGIGILFKVVQISSDSSMAPFINVHSARVSVGIGGGGQGRCWGLGGGCFCLIISKLLTGP